LNEAYLEVDKGVAFVFHEINIRDNPELMTEVHNVKFGGLIWDFFKEKDLSSFVTGFFEVARRNNVVII